MMFLIFLPNNLNSLTDDKGLLEGGPGDVVPGGSAGCVDGPLVGPQQRGHSLRLVGGAFLGCQRWCQGAAARYAAREAVQGFVATSAET